MEREKEPYGQELFLLTLCVQRYPVVEVMRNPLQQLPSTNKYPVILSGRSS